MGSTPTTHPASVCAIMASNVLILSVYIEHLPEAWLDLLAPNQIIVSFVTCVCKLNGIIAMDPIIGLSIVNAWTVLDVIALVQGPLLLNT